MGARQKQALDRPSQRARVAVRRVPALQAKAEARKARAHAPKILPSLRGSWRAALMFEGFALLMLVIMARGQFEIAWVRLSGQTAPATITAMSCPFGRYQTASVTVKFTDANGAAHTESHSIDTTGCFDQYHMGEVIPIWYVPFFPGALLTQAEVEDLPSEIISYGLIDVIALGFPILLLRYPAVVAALLQRLPKRKPAQRTRYGSDVKE